ncbi:hypothetical protein [Massilia sp. S19_KUP03_FR1]|uniref:hypothetical protein n=1 Tax=Massilia sp. S19_KUP03_FR1 TaxID=3025503 RepID=UPI002FCD4882
MANRECTTNEQASAITLPPIHQSFSWLSNNVATDANARLAADAKTVALGGMTVANIVRRNAMAPDSGLAPLLSGNDLDYLVGLLIFSLETLHIAAEDQIDRLSDAADAAEAAASKGTKK